MGNLPSSERTYLYRAKAQEAFRATRRLERELGGPRSRGAILAYIEGPLGAQTMILECTPLESNEFKRLDHLLHNGFMKDHKHLIPCRPVNGRCAYPREYIHSRKCAHRVCFPPGIEVMPLLPSESFWPPWNRYHGPSARDRPPVRGEARAGATSGGGGGGWGGASARAGGQAAVLPYEVEFPPDPPSYAQALLEAPGPEVEEVDF